MMSMKQVKISIEQVKELFNISQEKYFTFYFNDKSLFYFLTSKIFSINEQNDYLLIKRENEDKPRTILYFDDIKAAYVETFDLSKSLNKFVKVVYWDLSKKEHSTIEGVISHFNSEYDSITVTPKAPGASLSVLSYFIQSIEEMKIINQFDGLKPNDKCKVKLNNLTEVEAQFVEMSTTMDKDGSCKKMIKLVIASDNLILVKDEKEIKDGNIHTVINYYPNGKQIQEKFEIVYKDGKEIRNGKYESFFENGNLNFEVNYVNDLKQGKEVYYYLNGHISSTLMYKNGVLEGDVTYYYEEGQIKNVKSYVNGKIEGTQTVYHKNGNIYQVSNYKNNKLHGFFTTYLNDGKIAIAKKYYEDCKLTRSPFDLLLDKFMGISLKNFVTKGTYAMLKGMVKLTNDKSDFQGIHKLIHEDLTKKITKDGLKPDIGSILSQFVTISIEYCKLIDDSEKEEDMKSFLQKLSTKFNLSLQNSETDKKEEDNPSKMKDYIQKTIKVKYNDKIRTVIIQNVYTKNNKKYVSVTELFKGQLFEKTFFEDKIEILN